MSSQQSKKTQNSLRDRAAELQRYFRDMLLIRRFEEKAGQLYGMGLIGGFCHLYIGQEAVVVGINAAQKEGDSVITSYRDHGHMLACGMGARGVMAELTGRIGGYSKGKGGSMHMFSREKAFYGGHGIVGAQIPLGAGLGFAHQYKKDGHISVAYCGDGAFNQGQVFEAFNMAALWKLPVLFVVENNKYSMGTALKRHAAGELYKRGEPFGIPGRKVNGMDVLAVRAAADEMIASIRAGNGPQLMEVETYRYRGHSMSDPAKYRSKEEVESMRDKHDPIETLRALMVKEKLLNEEGFKLIEREIKDIVADCAEFAQTSPEPNPSELWTDILVEG
jgi:pyruvate dehydrogenase E1 component alpha subunit